VVVGRTVVEVVAGTVVEVDVVVRGTVVVTAGAVVVVVGAAVVVVGRTVVVVRTTVVVVVGLTVVVVAGTQVLVPPLSAEMRSPLVLWLLVAVRTGITAPVAKSTW